MHGTIKGGREAPLTHSFLGFFVELLLGSSLVGGSEVIYLPRYASVFLEIIYRLVSTST
jgi:hypothetical protein